jgi:hypothetical protein
MDHTDISVGFKVPAAVSGGTFMGCEVLSALTLDTSQVRVKITLRPTISRSVSPGFEAHLGLMT